MTLRLKKNEKLETAAQNRSLKILEITWESINYGSVLIKDFSALMKNRLSCKFFFVLIFRSSC